MNFKASFYRAKHSHETHLVGPILETSIYEAKSMTEAKKDAKLIAKNEDWRIIAVDQILPIK